MVSAAAVIGAKKMAKLIKTSFKRRHRSTLALLGIQKIPIASLQVEGG